MKPMLGWIAGAARRVGRFFWSWGFLKFALWTITLIVLLYVEEDWRGAHAWAATKAKWEAKGETFDYTKFIPPPVPDDENLAEIPVLKAEKVTRPAYSIDLGTGKTVTELEPTALRNAVDKWPMSVQSPKIGDWQAGKLPDMGAIKATVMTAYATAFPKAKIPADALDQYRAIYPFIADIRTAAAIRPYYRIESDYSTYPPFSRALGTLTQQIALSRVLTEDAILSFDAHQPDVALQDLEVNGKLMSGAERDPTLIGGLVAIGIFAIGDSAVYDGLAEHVWTDAQLADLESALGRFDFLAMYQFDIRGEAVFEELNIDYLAKTRPNLGPLLLGMNDSNENSAARVLSVISARYMPAGWWEQNRSQVIDVLLNSIFVVDVNSQRVFPDRSLDFQKRYLWMTQQRWDANAPWNVIVSLNYGWLTKQVIKFARMQVWSDESRIACALERYRLATGTYPATLDALAPAYIDAVPHDVMNGEPYHYRVKADGTFLLYSVGWNQTDDGGVVAHKQDAPNQVDDEQGDWVWPVAR